MGRMNDTMFMIQICQEFGWTYEQYMAQPNFFIRLIAEKMVRDAKQQEMSKKFKK